jgi:hypothetical protein
MVGAASSCIVVVRCGSEKGDDGEMVKSRGNVEHQQCHVYRSLNELGNDFESHYLLHGSQRSPQPPPTMLGQYFDPLSHTKELEQPLVLFSTTAILPT